MTWREKLSPIISRVIAEVGTDDQKALRRALRAAYPFDIKYGPRHQYHIWRDEVNRQLGKKKVKPVQETQEIELPLFERTC